MIIDHLNNSEVYSALGPNFGKAFEFVKKIDDTYETGTYELGPDLLAHIFEYSTSDYKSAIWESHKDVIDLQYCIRGVERIHFANKNLLEKAIDYNVEVDRFTYQTNHYFPYVDTGNGIFAIFFPDDAHAPQVCQNDPMLIKKVVVKIPVQIK